MRVSSVFHFTAVFTFVFFITSFSYAQKSKRVEVYKNKMYKDYVDVNYYYDNASNEVTSEQMVLYGRDLRNQDIDELVTIFYGRPGEVYKFLTELEAFLDENEADVSNTIEGRRATIVKMMGMKGVWVYEKDGRGYRGYNLKTLKKIKESIGEWATSNDVRLD
jgi:hypothetical protein